MNSEPTTGNRLNTYAEGTWSEHSNAALQARQAAAAVDLRMVLYHTWYCYQLPGSNYPYIILSTYYEVTSRRCNSGAPNYYK